MSRFVGSRWLPETTKVIAASELRKNLRSFRFLVSSALLAVLVALAVWVGLADYRLRLEAYEGKQAERDSSLILGNVYSSLQPIVLKTPNPMAIFERGVDAQEGTEVRITVGEVPMTAAGQNRGNPYLARLVGFDVTTVIKLVLGLGALLLTFDSMVGEHSRRRVELLSAHGVTPFTILSGSSLAVLGALTVSLTVALGPPLVVLFSLGVLPLENTPWLRLAGLLASYLAYGAVMALLGLGISLRASSVARSLVYATLAWLVLVILLPLALTAGVTAYADARFDPLEVERQVDRLELEKRRRQRELRARDPIRVQPSGHVSISNAYGDNDTVLHRFGSKAFNDSMARYYEDHVRLARLYAERVHLVRLQAAEEARSRLGLLGQLAAVLPGQMLDLTASTMAGTTSADHARFLEAAQTYRQIFLAYLEQKGAIGSWRWFTDDPPGGSPWPERFGMRPEEVTQENIKEAILLWQDEAVQAEVEATIAERERDDSGFDVSDLPPFRPDDAGSLGRRWLAAGPSLIMIGILWLLVLDAAGRSRVLFPYLHDQPPDDPLVSETPDVLLTALRRLLRGVSSTWYRSIYWAELAGVLRQLRWRASALLVVLTMMAGASIFAGRYQALEFDRRQATAAYETRLQEKSLAQMIDIGHPALRPPWSLGFLIDGEERVKPSSYRLPLTTWSRAELESPPVDTRRLSTMPSPDWSFVLRVLLSLVAFFIGYDALNGRRMARFRVQLASGTPLIRLVLGKSLALWTALALPFVIGAVLGFGVLRLHGHPVPEGGEWLKLWAFLGIGAWALGFYTVVTLWVSAWLGVGEKALVTLILLWISAVSVIPSAAGILVMGLEPLPPDWRVEADLKAIRVRADAEEGSDGFRRLEWARADDFAAEKIAARIQRRRRADQESLIRSLIERQMAQAERAERLAYLSPVSLLHDVLQSLLGSGIYRQRVFLEQFEEFEGSLESWAQRLDERDPESPHLWFFSRYYSQMPVLPDQVPRFEMREPSLAAGLRRAWIPLLLWSVITIVPTLLLPWTVEHRLANEKGESE